MLMPKRFAVSAGLSLLSVGLIDLQPQSGRCGMSAADRNGRPEFTVLEYRCRDIHQPNLAGSSAGRAAMAIE
jgi:hypothetical protein